MRKPAPQKSITKFLLTEEVVGFNVSSSATLDCVQHVYFSTSIFISSTTTLALEPFLVFVLQFLLDNMARRETHQCPFARSGVVLSRLLCDILHVGEVGKKRFMRGGFQFCVHACQCDSQLDAVDMYNVM